MKDKLVAGKVVGKEIIQLTEDSLFIAFPPPPRTHPPNENTHFLPNSQFDSSERNNIQFGM